MNERLIRTRALVLVGFVFFACVVWLVPYAGVDSDSETFTVTFLNVGQGDAVLVETPDGIDVLIDGGPGGSILRELSATLGAFDRTIDMVIATHPDTDHIGGLTNVLARYKVGTILMTNNEQDGPAVAAYTDAVAAEGAEVLYARAGQRFALGASTTLDVLFPRGDVTDMESNMSSIALRISYGETDVLLTGDAPSRIERYLVGEYGDALRSEILKVGHHGSRTSTDPAFIAVVSPRYGVISAGKDNTYGHPHDEVLDTLASFNVETLSTESGRVTFVSDGTTIKMREQ